MTKLCLLIEECSKIMHSVQYQSASSILIQQFEITRVDIYPMLYKGIKKEKKRKLLPCFGKNFVYFTREITKLCTLY